MAGVIGATSGKFVLMGAMLLFQGRVDGDRSVIAVAPGASVSTIAPGRRAGERVRIGIGAMNLVAAKPATGEQPGPKVGLTIGRDVLDANPVMIAFPSHRLRLLLPAEARRQEARMVAIPVDEQPGGALSVPLAIDDAAATPVPLDLTSATAVVAPTQNPHATVSIGAHALPGIAVTAGDTPKVGLLAFARCTVIFDLSHHRIWVS